MHAHRDHRGQADVVTHELDVILITASKHNNGMLQPPRPPFLFHPASALAQQSRGLDYKIAATAAATAAITTISIIISIISRSSSNNRRQRVALVSALGADLGLAAVRLITAPCQRCSLFQHLAVLRAQVIHPVPVAAVQRVTAFTIINCGGAQGADVDLSVGGAE